MLKHQTIEETDEDGISTEEQAIGEEEEKPKKKFRFRTLLNYWTVAAKLLELILSLLCVNLIIDPLRVTNLGSGYFHHFSLIFTTYAGYTMIIAICLVGRLFGDRMPYKTSAIFSLVGSGLFLTTGILVLSDRSHFSRKYIFHPNGYMLDMMFMSGIFSLVNAIIFTTDAIFTLRLQKDL